jgi:hypothetical protein
LCLFFLEASEVFLYGSFVHSWYFLFWGFQYF